MQNQHVSNSKILMKRQHFEFDLGDVCNAFLSEEKISVEISDHFIRKFLARSISITDVVNKFEAFLDQHYNDIIARLKYCHLGCDIRIVGRAQVLVLEAKTINSYDIHFTFITIFDECGGLDVLLTGNEYYV